MAWKGWEDFIPSAKQYVAPSRLPALSAPDRHEKRAKYGAVPQWVLPGLQMIPVEKGKPKPAGAIRFASQREAERFVTLRRKQELGAIAGLELQPAYSMDVYAANGCKVSIGVYRADFRYMQAGSVIVEDVKGLATPVYKMKKKHVEAQYGVSIVEV